MRLVRTIHILRTDDPGELKNARDVIQVTDEFSPPEGDAQYQFTEIKGDRAIITWLIPTRIGKTAAERRAERGYT
jgi:hypothetical protein